MLRQLSGKPLNMCLAIPGIIVDCPEQEGPFRQAHVDFGGIRRLVNLACTPDAQPGDYVLVHAGMAITVLDPAEATRTLAAWAELNEHDADLLADFEQANPDVHTVTQPPTSESLQHATFPEAPPAP